MTDMIMHQTTPDFRKNVQQEISGQHRDNSDGKSVVILAAEKENLFKGIKKSLYFEGSSDMDLVKIKKSARTEADDTVNVLKERFPIETNRD